MPIFFQTDSELLSSDEAERLWQATLKHTDHVDDEVAVRFVDEEESRRLNLEYRKKDKPTNVLTFSYGDGRHDIALCMAVVEREAGERGVELRDYIALVLVHAFLHATGMDHERSVEEAEATGEAEHSILKQAGFNAILW